MAGNFLEAFRDLERKATAPEYNFNLINQNLESLPDPLGAVLRIVEVRNKRDADEKQRQEANRRLQEQLALKHDEMAQKDREVAEAEVEQMQDVHPPTIAAEELNEPEVNEALCLVPPQPLPVVDLSWLGLPHSLPRDEALVLLQQLVNTRQLFAYAGAFDGQSAGPILRALFDMVAFGENPFSGYQQLVRYYSDADTEDLGWSPTLQDFFAALTKLGYQALKGHSGGRKRSTGQDGLLASSRGEAGGGSRDGGSLGSRLLNLQGLLRLLADLTGLHLRGRVDLGFGNQDQAAGKGLITALLRMLMDLDLSALMHADVCAALEGLMLPWNEALWRRICDETVVVAANLGPSHRAAYRVITGAEGFSERMRTWQQHAAVELLRKTLPQGLAGSSGSGSSHRGLMGVDIQQVRVLLGPATPASARALLSAMGRSSRDRGSGGGTAAGPDYWRLLTVLQCTHVVVWTAAYNAEGEEVDAMVRWISTFLKCMEQSLRGQQPTVMRIKVFLADVQTNYELLRCSAE